MAGLTDIPGVEIHGKGQKDFVLPVGHIDAQGKLHDHVVIREMDGYDDDMMGNDDLPIGERVSNVLAACITKLGDITDKDTIKRAVSDDLQGGLPITEQDRIAAMIFLRRTSMGDMLKFQRTCPRCGESAKNRSLDLRTIKIEKSPHPEKRRVKVKLPGCGQEAVLKVLTAKGSIEIGRLRPTTKDLKSLALLARIEMLGGKKIDPRTDLEAVKALPQRDRVFMRQLQNQMEASVDTDIEVKCKNPICGGVWTFPLDVGQGFFLDLDGEVDMQTATWL